jgi:shikimate dehydrogenase
MPRIDTATQLCAVIGAPVGHSLSPAMHNAAFEATGLNYVYVAFHVDDVAACLAGMRALRSFRGMSVTIPHKMAVMPHLDEIDSMAVNVGCVNTIVNEHGRLLGSTTDGLGTLKAFADAGVELRGKRVLFLGAGGAVRSVAFAFADIAGVAHITLLGRSAEKVRALADDLAAKTPCSVTTGDLSADLASVLATHDVVVQGTPVGMYPHAGETSVPNDLLRANQVVFDMVYRPLKTRLIEDAESAGCKTILGVEMLVNQAALQFEAWTGVNAPYGVMRDALLAELTKG